MNFISNRRMFLMALIASPIAMVAVAKAANLDAPIADNETIVSSESHDGDGQNVELASSRDNRRGHHANRLHDENNEQHHSRRNRGSRHHDRSGEDD